MSVHAFLFPGQGSQRVGMGQDLWEAHPQVRDTYAAAEQILEMPLAELSFSGPEAELQQTRVTQPAIYVHSVAALQVLAAAGVEPAATAGHSLGEYAAVVAAGALEWRAGLRLVQRRAQLMQAAGNQQPGAMAAVLGLTDAAVLELCAQAASHGTVVAANFNAPGQVVVSGERVAVARLGELARAAGARRFVALDVSGAFHSPLMEPAAAALRDLLADTPLVRARVPVVGNATAAAATEPEAIRQGLAAQMVRPVRWVECVATLTGLGVRTAVEVGPGGVLKGLVRRIDPNLMVHPGDTATDLAAAAQLTA